MVKFASCRQHLGAGIPSTVFCILFTVLAVFFSSALDARSANFYISPGGSDSNSGSSSSSAWKTFKYAVPKLKPGDTLVLLDGTYNEPLFIDCTRNAFNGTEQSSITIKAQNERKAFLQGNGISPPFNLQNCSFWVVEGIRAENRDNPNVGSGSQGHVFVVYSSSDIKLRRLLGACPNRYENTHVFNIGNSSNILIEECEAYWYHRHGLNIYQSSFVTIRRCYTNSRDYSDISGGYKSINPKLGDTGISLYLSTNSIVENSIFENNDINSNSGQRNLMVGNIALNNNIGFTVTHHSDINYSNNDNVLINNLSISNNNGFFIRSAENVTMENNTAINNSDSGIKADNDVSSQYRKVSWTIYPSITVRDSLVVGNSINGLRISDSDDFTNVTLQYLSAFDNYRDYCTEGLPLTNSKTIDPQLGSCVVYIPKSSPMKKAGINGADIGANIVYRYEDGVLTTQKLWNQNTGQFPCGATIKGINDDATFPNSACVNVNERLNVGVNGCPIP